MAAIALLRMHGYTNDESYHEKAEDTLEVFAGMAEQFGIFGATYGAAGVYFTQPHTQVVVIGEGDEAQRLYVAAVSNFAFNQAAIKLTPNEAVAPNLPPTLSETIPNLPEIRGKVAIAVVCSGATCQPPVSDPKHLQQQLRASNSSAA
ncbi:MAG TPA: hypothetical protein VLL05_18955 [Terriglobales bacterium]|nr:hypothetical protein [Terriglobales bacterium]